MKIMADDDDDDDNYDDGYHDTGRVIGLIPAGATGAEIAGVHSAIRCFG